MSLPSVQNLVFQQLSHEQLTVRQAAVGIMVSFIAQSSSINDTVIVFDAAICELQPPPLLSDAHAEGVLHQLAQAVADAEGVPKSTITPA